MCTQKCKNGYLCVHKNSFLANFEYCVHIIQCHKSKGCLRKLIDYCVHINRKTAIFEYCVHIINITFYKYCIKFDDFCRFYP